MLRTCFLPLILAASLLCAGCLTVGLDPRLTAVPAGDMPQRDAPIPTRLVVNFKEDGKQKTGTRHDGYRLMKQYLEESGVFVVRSDADAEVNVTGHVNIQSGALPRAFLTGFTFGLVGFSEKVDEAVTMRFTRDAQQHEQSYAFQHRMGTGIQSGAVADRAGDSFDGDEGARQMIKRVVDRFIVELNERGMLR